MYHTQHKIQEAMSEYLSLPEWNWTHYITQTFDDRKCRPYSKICEHSWRYFLNRFGGDATMLYGWMFAEKGKMGRLHWHAIVHIQQNLFKEPNWGQIRDGMFDKYGRVTVESYKPGADVLIQQDAAGVATAVSRYLTKYVAKDSAGGDTTWDFGGFMNGSEADASQLCSAIGVRTAKL